jgi:predicted negative regulator of RcsB-dependent stress response
MKKATKKPREKTIIGIVPKRRHLLLIGVAVIVIVLAVGGVFGWRYLHRSKSPTTAQKAAESSLSDQQKAVDVNKDQSVYIRTTTYINLSETYAVAGKCQEARDTLHQAEQIATSQSTKRLNEAKDIINSNC